MYTEKYENMENVAAYAQIGFKMFPDHGIVDGNCTCGKTCDSPGKHPATKNGLKDASGDMEILKGYFEKNPEKNIGLATGEPSGVWVLDEDDDGTAMRKEEKKNGSLPLTWTAKTGGGGKHRFFKFTDAVKNKKNSVKFVAGLDIRTTGGHVVLSPGTHKSGARYKWIISPNDSELAEAPQWLLDLMPDREEKAKKADAESSQASPGAVPITKARTLPERAMLYLEKVPGAVSGENGSGVTYGVCCKLCELFPDLDEDEIFGAMSQWNQRCTPPWSETDLRRKISEAKKKVPADDDLHEIDDTYPRLSPDAYHGLAGEILRKLEPVTECDPAALLMTFLTGFGVAVGRNPHFRVEGTKHHANIFSLIVGATSRARKGTSLGRIKEILHESKPKEASGLSTGEGLVFAVRDPSLGVEDSKPITDKRLWVIESEFARCLKVMRRESNTLSSILRDAWDTGDLSVMTKVNALSATDAHIGITGHITMKELTQTLGETDVYNGFGNRILWVYSQRSKSLPDGGNVDLTEIRAKVKACIGVGIHIGQMKRSPEAAELWRKVYSELGQEKEDSLWDAITSRADAQVVRLSMLYALLDGSEVIEVIHLKAALAVWEYCDATAKLLFFDSSVETLDQKILKIVSTEPGIKKSVCRNRFGHDASMSRKFAAALSRLISKNKIISVGVMAGRQAEVLYPSPTSAKSAKSAESEIRGEETADRHDMGAKSQSPLNPRSEDKQKGVEPERGGEANSLNPQNPLNPRSEDKREGPTPATLGELFEWANESSVEWKRESNGGVWVTPAQEEKLTPALTAAIRANQPVLDKLCPHEMCDEEWEAEMRS